MDDLSNKFESSKQHILASELSPRAYNVVHITLFVLQKTLAASAILNLELVY
jgi:hypothetical protein